MGGNELKERLAVECNISLRTADKVLKSLRSIIYYELLHRGKFSLPGVIKLTTRKRKKYQAYCPTTNTEVIVPESLVPIAKVSDKLRNILKNCS